MTKYRDYQLPSTLYRSGAIQEDLNLFVNSLPVPTAPPQHFFRLIGTKLL